MQSAISQTPGRTAAAADDWLRTVIERSCREFGGRLTQECILDIARETETRYRDARVSSYVPILAGRFARERLLQILAKDTTK